jgi:hypothetical protein
MKVFNMTDTPTRFSTALEQGIIRAYFCGGCGINIGSHFLNRKSETGYAAIQKTFVDTSKANLFKAGITDESSVMLLPATDGSGKIRAENATEISDSIKPLLLKHKPEDFNVVVFSASGGSGSVFGPLIISELLSRDANVLAMIIGSEESLLTANNTINTFKSLDAITKKHNKPITMYYVHNVQGKPRSEADAEMREAISSIALLASRQNSELDTRDVANWIGFHRSTSVKAQLALLDIVDSAEAAANIKSPVAVASLYRNEASPTLTITPDYVCTGYFPANFTCPVDFHYVISCDDVISIASNIQSRLDGMRETTASRTAQTSLVKTTDHVEDNGLVL